MLKLLAPVLYTVSSQQLPQEVTACPQTRQHLGNVTPWNSYMHRISTWEYFQSHCSTHSIILFSLPGTEVL